MSSIRQRTASRFLPAAILALGAGVVVLGGCGNIRHDTVHAPTLRSNLTPELANVAQRSDDISNALAISNDTNLRQMVNDLGSVWYADRPTRLQRGPAPR